MLFGVDTSSGPSAIGRSCAEAGMRQPSGGCALVALELLLSTGAGDGVGGLTGRATVTAGGAIGGGEGAEGGCKETGAAGVEGSSAGAGTAAGTIGAAGGMSPPASSGSGRLWELSDSVEGAIVGCFDRGKENSSNSALSEIMVRFETGSQNFQPL